MWERYLKIAGKMWAEYPKMTGKMWETYEKRLKLGVFCVRDFGVLPSEYFCDKICIILNIWGGNYGRN